MSCKVALLISSLRCGGAERVGAVLVNGLCARGYDVSVVTLTGPEKPFYPLSAGVRLVALDLAWESRSFRDAVRKNIRRLGAIRCALRRLKPDVLISFLTETNVLAVIASRVLGREPCRTVVSEHIYPPAQGLIMPWRIGRRLAYPLAEAVVPCGRHAGSWFGSWMPKRKIRVIENPVTLEDRAPDPAAEELAREMAGGHWILGMGRLATQKGFDLLFEAFALLPAQERKGWKVGVIGEGPLRDELEGRITALGLGRDVALLGRFANPAPLLRAGKIFALSSRFEGFPIALAEAMACGMAVAAFDCPTGPAEIIRDGVDGLLVPPENPPALAATLARLMKDDSERRRLSSRAPEVLERYSERRFLDGWQRLIDSLPRRSVAD